MAKNSLKTASVLAFERKLDPSDALLFSGNWDNKKNAKEWESISVREKSVRGTISNRLKTKDQDPTKIDAAIENPNLQTVDIASLGSEQDTLQVRFTLRVLPGAGTPSACNNADYQQRLQEVVGEYIKEHSFSELSRRYAANLANGRFLWRNRMGAEQVEVHVGRLVDGVAQQTYVFNSLEFSLRDFGNTSPELEQLGHIIEAGLSGEEHVLLEVTAFARLGAAQEVFPSQELILDRGRGDKSKTLYSVSDVAALHSQKVGNALRTIDTWYPVDEGQAEIGPIAIEPYGSVTTEGRAYRQPKQKADFYNLLDNWLLKGEVPEVDQQHYVMATLVRGGVFGDAS